MREVGLHAGVTFVWWMSPGRRQRAEIQILQKTDHLIKTSLTADRVAMAALLYPNNLCCSHGLLGLKQSEQESPLPSLLLPNLGV